MLLLQRNTINHATPPLEVVNVNISILNLYSGFVIAPQVGNVLWAVKRRDGIIDPSAIVTQYIIISVPAAEMKARGGLRELSDMMGITAMPGSSRVTGTCPHAQALHVCGAGKAYAVDDFEVRDKAGLRVEPA